MRLKIYLRSVAAALLHAALKIAPPYAAEWGRAMLHELRHVEGDWAAFVWAVGGAGMLTKHALFSLLIPGQSKQIAPTEAEFFAKENPVRKSTLIAAAVCLAASLLFFAVPAYRQAFQISLAQGHGLISGLRGNHTDSLPGPYFAKVAEEAKKSHDAEGLAFAAIHRYGAPDSAELAEDAVRLDPKLTWIYAFMVNRNWSVPGAAPEIEWVSKLAQFDRQNALPDLILAQQAASGKYNGAEMSITAWQSAMAAAFASSKLDTYGDRLKELDYKVALRYGINDPYQAANLSEFFLQVILPRTGNPKDYAKLLLNSGDALAARGDHRDAAKQYLLAAHFGEMVQPRQKRGVEGFILGWYANTILQGPYHRLAILSEKQGNKEQARLFSDLAARADQGQQEDNALAKQFVASEDRVPWNAHILNVSAIAMFFCAGVVLLCAIVVIARSRSIEVSKLHPGRTTAVIGYGGVIGLLLSSTALYFSYRPYAETVRAYLRDGDPSRLRTVALFFDYLEYSSFYALPNYMVYFWTGIISLCAVALVFTTVKYMSRYRRPAMAA
jgi:hypothetical protein